MGREWLAAAAAVVVPLCVIMIHPAAIKRVGSGRPDGAVEATFYHVDPFDLGLYLMATLSLFLPFMWLVVDVDGLVAAEDVFVDDLPEFGG